MPQRELRGCSLLFSWGFWLTLIALLFAGLMGGSRMHPKAYLTEARSTCEAFCAAISQFQIDYVRLPLPVEVSSGKGADTDTTTAAAAGIVAKLKGIDEAVNPMGNDYLGDIKDARTLSDGTYLNGIWRDGDQVALFDPWGHYYRIRLDSDDDGFVTDPRDATKKLPGPAVIWSIGKDGDPDIWDDNVIVPEK